MNQFERYRKIRKSKQEVQKAKSLKNPELDFSLISKNNIDYLLGVVDNNNYKDQYFILQTDINNLINYNEMKSSIMMKEPFFDDCIEIFILKMLCKNYEPVFMSLNLHFNMWVFIDANLHELDDSYQPGINKYFKYCLDTGINKRLLDNLGTTLFPDLIWMFLFHEDPLDEVLKRINSSDILFEQEVPHG